MFFSLIDRNAQIRNNKAEINLKRQDNQSRFILYADENFFCKGQNLYFTWQELIEIQEQLSEVIYLGQDQKYHYFAYHLINSDPEKTKLEQENLKQLPLKQAYKFASEFDSSLLFYTQGLIRWHEKHQFCSKCGEKTLKSQSGHARECVNQKCASQHFPKIEPAVIFSVINNSAQESKILMARQASWDKGRFSVIAGFVEAGESLEDAVKREAYEETGLAVEQIHYISSQPWPFPSSLMLGFSCVTSGFEINLIDQELEQADWFSANQLESKIKSGEMLLPFSLSISWQLIDRWFTQQKGYSIENI